MKVPNEVTEFLKAHIETCGKTQRAIAAETGFESVNMVSMMKTGCSKVPIERARILARSVGADEAYFVTLVLKTYHPELWSAIADLIAQDRFERAAMIVVRKKAKDPEVVLANAA